jgi:hypothetical protein
MSVDFSIIVSRVISLMVFASIRRVRDSLNILTSRFLNRTWKCYNQNSSQTRVILPSLGHSAKLPN